MPRCTWSIFYIYMKCVVKLTAIRVVARLCLWTVASANWCASTVLSKVATPISAPCLRVSWKKKCGTLSVRVTLTPSPHVLLQLSQGPQEAQEECRRRGAKWDFDEINFRFHFYFKEGSKCCKNVMKLTAVLAGTFLVLFLRTQSANWGAPAILSRIAPPRSDLSLRVSCKNKLTKLRKCASRVREDTPPWTMLKTNCTIGEWWLP